MVELIAETVLKLLALGVLFLIVAVIWAFVASSPSQMERRAREAMLAEDRRRHALEQSWVDDDEWPLTHYEVYGTGWELAQDLARMKAMGYVVEWQEHLEEGVAVTYSLEPAYEDSRKARKKKRRRQEEEEEDAYLS